jgi:hypothetical protein
MGGRWGAPGGFFADADFDYEARIVLGAAASGIGDAVADPGVVDVSAGWTAHLVDLFTAVRRYQVRDVVGQISMPMLILDQWASSSSPASPASCMTCCPGEKRIIEFTQAQGANFHCQPTGRQLTHTQMLDWLAEHLPARQAADTSSARPT